MAQVARRAAVLFVFGLLVYAFPHFDLGTQRILGVLQRIAICYLIASAIYLYTGVRGQILWIVGLFAAYWMMMTLIPVPGYGAGRLDVEGNFAHYVDRLVLGTHNYAHTRTWDPEGVVSTLPAIATALFGVLAGQILRLRRELAGAPRPAVRDGKSPAGRRPDLHRLAAHQQEALDRFLLPLHGGPGFHRLRHLCLVHRRTGMAQAGQAVRHLRHERDRALHGFRGTGRIPGRRACRSHHAATVHLSWWFVPLASPANASLLYSLSFVAVIYLVAYFLYRRGWFLRV